MVERTARAARSVRPSGPLPAPEPPSADSDDRAGPEDAPGVDIGTLDLLPDGVLVVDHDGIVVAVNDAASQLLDRSWADTTGQPLDVVAPLVDDDGRAWWDHTTPFEGLQTRTRQPERLLWLPDGQAVFVTASFVRADGPGKALQHLVVVLRPATERSRLERRGAELVATAAHELRSPLTSIKGFTTTLLTKWSRFTDDQRRLMLETVEADADRLTRLITDLLDVARLDSGRLRLDRTWVDLEARVRHAVRVLVAGGTEPDRFSVEVEGEIPPVWADGDKLEQICLNLLENAIRHGEGVVSVVLAPSRMPSGILGRPDGDGPAGGGPRQAVAGTTDVDGGAQAVTVAVCDEGAGIPEHLVARAFHKFWHTGSSGTGLGLYLVRGMVEAHGGAIHVDRGPAGGARFRFRLPVGSPDIAG